MQTRYTGCCQQRVLDLLQTAVYRRCWNTARPRMEARALITTTFLGGYETRLPDRVFILVHRVPSSNRGIFLFLDPMPDIDTPNRRALVWKQFDIG